MTDVTALTVVMDYHDEAVLLSSDVEHDELTNLIGAAEELPHIREILPASSFNCLDPMLQPRLSIRKLFPELL